MDVKKKKISFSDRIEEILNIMMFDEECNVFTSGEY